MIRGDRKRGGGFIRHHDPDGCGHRLTGTRRDVSGDVGFIDEKWLRGVSARGQAEKHCRSRGEMKQPHCGAPKR
jgi:hypothetical protein